MEKILVTGAGGYLGATVFETLKNHPDHPGVSALDGRLENISAGSLDCNVVIHCAGALRHRSQDFDRSNVDGTRKLLAGVKPACRVIYISSKSVYAADYGKRLTEDAPVKPFDDYGRSKLEGEDLVASSDCPWLILRSGNLFGLGVGNPGMTFPTKALRDFCRGREVTLIDPDILHDYLYVWDLASLVVSLALRNPFLSGVYNIAGPARSLHQLIYRIAEHVKKADGIDPVINRKPGTGSWFNLLDSSKLSGACGGITYTDDELVIARLAGHFQTGCE